MAAYSGARPVPYALHEDKGFSFSADEILDRVNDNTRLIILNSPGNPTGGSNLEAEVEALARGLEAFPDCAVLSDEIYSRLYFDGASHLSLLRFEALRDRLIVLDGWSKTYAMTGWRLGWGIWPASMIGAATKLAINIHSCVNAPAQAAALAALEGPQDDVETMRLAFQARRDLIHARLNALPGVTAARPKGAFYAFPNISGLGLSAQQVQDQWLEDLNVAAIAGTSFGAAGEGYVRLSFANSTENIEAALDRIEGWVQATLIRFAALPWGRCINCTRKRSPGRGGSRSACASARLSKNTSSVSPSVPKIMAKPYPLEKLKNFTSASIQSASESALSGSCGS